MSSPQASDATSPSAEGQLEDAVSAFSDAVFEATQGLLKAQQELTRTVLSGRSGQRDEHEQEPVPVTTETSGQEHGDDRFLVRPRATRAATPPRIRAARLMRSTRSMPRLVRPTRSTTRTTRATRGTGSPAGDAL